MTVTVTSSNPAVATLSCASSIYAHYYYGATPASLATFCGANIATHTIIGGSGGPSILYSRPAWQQGTVFGLPTVSTGANSTYGSPTASTFTATVSGSGSFPIGAVSFSVSPPIGSFGSADALVASAGCSTGGTCTESATQAYTPPATLPGGSYTVTASYNSTNENYMAGSATSTFTTSQQTPKLSVLSTRQAAGIATATFTATIAYTGAGLPPSGPVTFQIDSSAAMTATCQGTTSPITCTGSYPTGGLSPGSHYLIAAQGADANYTGAGAVGTLYIQTVPTIAWAPSTLKIYAGNALGAGVLDATSPTAGSFTYTAALGAGSPVAVTSTSVLAAGSYTLTAIFTPTDSSTYASTTASVVFTVASQSIFVVNPSGVASFLNTGAVQSGAASGGGIGAAVDASGYVWSLNTAGTSLSRFTDLGALAGTYSGGGLNAAKALAIDGLGRIWVANATSVSAFSNAGTPISATAVATAGNLNAPASSMNAAGSLWIANSGNNTVTEVIGVAAPAVAPAVTAVSNGNPGTRP